MKTPQKTRYTDKDSGLLNAAEVCTLAKIEARTLQNWLSVGEIEVLVKIGGINYFSKKDLNAKFKGQLFL